MQVQQFIQTLDKNTFQGAFVTLCVVGMAGLAALIFWCFRSKPVGESENFLGSVDTNGGAAETGEAEGEEDHNVFDISTFDDKNLEMSDDEVGVLMFFYAQCNEVCDDEQWGAVEKLSIAREEILFVSIDATYPDTAPIAALHGVLHLPTFVFRRKGDIGYQTIVGRFDQSQLADFIDRSLRGEETAPAA